MTTRIASLVLLCTVLVTAPKPPPGSGPSHPCHEYKDEFCASETHPGAIKICLSQYKALLSDECNIKLWGTVYTPPTEDTDDLTSDSSSGGSSETSSTGSDSSTGDDEPNEDDGPVTFEVKTILAGVCAGDAASKCSSLPSQVAVIGCMNQKFGRLSSSCKSAWKDTTQFSCQNELEDHCSYAKKWVYSTTTDFNSLEDCVINLAPSDMTYDCAVALSSASVEYEAILSDEIGTTIVPFTSSNNDDDDNGQFSDGSTIALVVGCIAVLFAGLVIGGKYVRKEYTMFKEGGGNGQQQAANTSPNAHHDDGNQDDNIEMDVAPSTLTTVAVSPSSLSPGAIDTNEISLHRPSISSISVNSTSPLYWHDAGAGTDVPAPQLSDTMTAVHSQYMHSSVAPGGPALYADANAPSYSLDGRNINSNDNSYDSSYSEEENVVSDISDVAPPTHVTEAYYTRYAPSQMILSDRDLHTSMN